MEEERKDGSHVHATTRNLLNFADYFDSYTQGRLFGFCMFWIQAGEPQAVMLIGEHTSHAFGKDWDTDREKCAIVWGVYVRPEHRGKNIGLELERTGCPVILKLGFSHVETMVRAKNNHAEKMALDLGTHIEAHMHVGSIQEIQRLIDKKELSHD